MIYLLTPLVEEACDGRMSTTDILSRKDPNGYYVILAKRSALDLVSSLSLPVIAQDEGRYVVFKTRSRSIAKKLVEQLKKVNALVEQP